MYNNYERKNYKNKKQMDKIIEDIKNICNKDTNPFKYKTYLTLSLKEHYKGLYEIENTISFIFELININTTINDDIKQLGSLYTIIPIDCSYGSLELIKMKYGVFIKRIESN